MDYDKIPNTTLDQDLLKTIVLDAAPSELKPHLQILGSDVPYAQTGNTIELYLRARDMWNVGSSSEPQPMDTGAVDSDGCSRCGKSGHNSGECPYYEYIHSGCGKAGHLKKMSRR